MGDLEKELVVKYNDFSSFIKNNYSNLTKYSPSVVILFALQEEGRIKLDGDRITISDSDLIDKYTKYKNNIDSA